MVRPLELTALRLEGRYLWAPHREAHAEMGFSMDSSGALKPLRFPGACAGEQ